MIGRFKGNIFVLKKGYKIDNYFNNEYYKLSDNNIHLFSSAFALLDNKIKTLKPNIYDIEKFEKILFSENVDRNSFLDEFIYKNEKYIYINYFKIKYTKCKKFKTEFEEIKKAEKFVSDFLDNIDNIQKEQILLVFNELFFNAYEHGNLGISFEEKEKLLQENRYMRYLKNRKTDKLINICISKFIYKDKIYIACKITDEGEGFDVNKRKKAVYNGRGLILSDKICNGIFYNEKGNSVLFIKEMK